MPKKTVALFCMVLVLLAVSGCSFHRHSGNPDVEIIKLKRSQSQLQKQIDSLSTRLDTPLAERGPSRDAEKVRADIEELRRSVNALQAKKDLQSQAAPAQGAQRDSEVIEIRQSQRQLQRQVDSLSSRLDLALADRQTPDEIDKIKVDIEDLRLSIGDVENEIEQPPASQPPGETGRQPSQPQKAEPDTVSSTIKMYYKSGQYDEVVRVYREAVRSHPETRLDPGTLLDVAMAFMQLGRNSEYASLLRNIVQEYPGTVEAGIATDLLEDIPK